MEDLYIKVNAITDRIIDFNGYLYKMLKCSAKLDAEPFDTLVPVEVEVKEGDVLGVVRCKIVHIDHELDYVRIAIRVDKCEVYDETHEVSKYYNIPFIGKIKTHSRNKPKNYGPDNQDFYMVPIQLQEPTNTDDEDDSKKSKSFVIMLLSFGSKTKLLQSFANHTIIRGTATLKHKPDTDRYQLALLTAEPYSG